MMANTVDRIVVLIDMDCFFCQVETRLQPELKGKPLAVVQYNRFTIGKIIAASYEARNRGIKKHMIANEAKEICPDLLLVSAPVVHGKSDVSRYRNGGREVIEVLKKHSNIVERSSVDEAYLDITDIVDQKISEMCFTPKGIILSLPNTFIVGYSEVGENDEEQRSEGLESWITMAFEEFRDNESQRLAVAGVLVEQMRADVLEKTGFNCSAGISYNKFLAKLACGLHKPNRQTILPSAGVTSLFSTVPVKKVRNLGGKFGDVVVESLGCKVLADLLPYSLQDLQTRFDEKTGLRLYNIARGIDNEPVTTKLEPKSISACKEFNGSQAIITLETLEHWVGELAAELCNRLQQDEEEYKRRATVLTVSCRLNQNGKVVSQSRSCPLTSYKVEKIAKQSVDVIIKAKRHSIGYLGISAGKFVQVNGSNRFVNFFKTSNQIDANTTQHADQPRPHTFGIQEINDTPKPSTSSTTDSRINKKHPNSCKNIYASTHAFEVGSRIAAQKNLAEKGKHTNELKNKNKDSSADSRSPNTYLNIKKYAVSDQQSSSDDDSVQSIEMLHGINSELANTSNTNAGQTTADGTVVQQLTTINSALHADNFKKSFFMNIFNKSNPARVESDAHCNSSINSRLNDETSVDYRKNEAEAEPLPLNSITSECRFDSQASSSDIFAEDNSNSGSSKEEITGSLHSDTRVRISDHSEKDTGYKKKETSDSDSDETDINLDIANKRSLDNTSNACEVLKRVTSSTGYESINWESNEIDRATPKKWHRNTKEANLCVEVSSGRDVSIRNCENRSDSEIQSTVNSEKSIKSNETNEEQSAIVQLKEIFPDLNNIDQSIVALLPPLLQKEANLHMDGQKEKSVEYTVKSGKLPNAKLNKTKPSNVKSDKNVNKINAFFSKSSGSNASESGSSAECSKCKKSISLEKYMEHLDFHVAQDLQKAINSSPIDDFITSKGEKYITEPVIEPTRTKRTKNETVGTRKKCKSIASFFS